MGAKMAANPAVGGEAAPGVDRAREMALFAAVHDCGSFSGAGRVLGLSPSAVSRGIDRIEARLGVRLLLRSTRALAMTAEGQAYLRAARRMHDQRFADHGGYSRAICFSLWRTFSPGPQDWPLAVCDGRSVSEAETASNTLFVVDEFPEGDALTAPVAGEENMIAATIFRCSPAHRWWYFANMAADDVLLFKFNDSDESVTWRCPHTAFHDTSLPDTRVRSSIEVRCIAYFD